MPYKPLSWVGAAAWMLAAAASFHAACEFPDARALMFGFFLCVYRLAHLRSTGHAWRVGWLLGLMLYAPQLAFFWGIFQVSAIGLWLVLACWLGLYFTLQRFALVKFGAWGAALMAPVLWMGLEYSRSELYYLRFSWVNAGYALPEISWWTGMYGVGFVLMLLAALAVTAVDRKRWVVAVLIAGAAVSGLLWIRPGTPAPSNAPQATHLNIAGVQLEFPSNANVMARLDELHALAPHADVFVLSEYTFEASVPQAVRDWCAKHKRYLIAGGRDLIGEGLEFRNTVFVIGPDGQEVFRQVKCVPIQFFRDGHPAEEQRVWESPWGKLGLCVCYDLSYTRVTDELVRQGARAIIVPTMDMERWGERQHLLHCKVAPTRAAEYGIPIFRLCSSGISQNVSATGGELARAAFPGQGDKLIGYMTLAPEGRFPADRYFAWPAVAVCAAMLAWCVVDAFRVRGVLREARG